MTTDMLCIRLTVFVTAIMETKQVTSVIYLRLNLPEFRLFSTVHFAVDDQNIWETSDVACLHLKWCAETLVMQKRLI